MIDIKYAAGFFDGEGCVGIYPREGRHNTHHRLRTSVAQKNPAILYRLEERWGGYLTGGQGTSQVCYRWNLGPRGSEIFLREIEPYLTQKRAQAKLALAFRRECFSKKNSRRRLTVEEVEKREAFRQVMGELNARD